MHRASDGRRAVWRHTHTKTVATENIAHAINSVNGAFLGVRQTFEENLRNFQGFLLVSPPSGSLTTFKMDANSPPEPASGEPLQSTGLVSKTSRDTFNLSTHFWMFSAQICSTSYPGLRELKELSYKQQRCLGPIHVFKKKNTKTQKTKKHSITIKWQWNNCTNRKFDENASLVAWQLRLLVGENTGPSGFFREKGILQSWYLLGVPPSHWGVFPGHLSPCAGTGRFPPLIASNTLGPRSDAIQRVTHTQGRRLIWLSRGSGLNQLPHSASERNILKRLWVNSYPRQVVYIAWSLVCAHFIVQPFFPIFLYFFPFLNSVVCFCFSLFCFCFL